MTIFPQSTEICLDNMLYFYFFERFLIKSSLDDFIFESVVVLSLEDEEVSFFVRAIAALVDEIMSF